MKMVSDVNSTDSDIAEVPIPRSIRLVLLIIFDIPSFICTIFVLFHLLNNRLLRESLHNHVIIALLFSILPTHLIDIPFYIIYLSLGYVWPANYDFCRFWSFVAVGIFDTTGILMGYAAIERHILVFHDPWISNRRRRIFIHYLPLLIVITYSLTFYVYAILFPPCIDNFDYKQPWCSYPCYYDENILSMFDTIFNAVVPTLVVLIFSVGLLLRFMYQRRQLVLTNRWRKYRKMIIQLISVSSLRIIFDLPGTILTLAHLWGLSSDVGLIFGQYAYFFTYSMSLLLPFVCLGSLPEIYKKLTKICSLAQPRRTATVLPVA